MIRQSAILEYSGRVSTRKSTEVVNEAKQEGRQTAFLSHSHQDAMLAKSLQAFLHAQGWFVYIDWEDMHLPSKPNRVTAQKIKYRIEELDWFLYLATKNSNTSRWCPWEIGYADGVKNINRIIIIPTQDSQGDTYGNEYLDLYRSISLTKRGDYRIFEHSNARSGHLLNEMSLSFL